jgi:biofilm PGA synthesis N-glycosyltransferase PgaC
VGLYWRYESWIRKNLSRVDSMLGATGPIYAIRRALAVPIPPEILLDDVYLPLTAMFRGYRLVHEESAKAFDFPTALGSEFRRKVRTQAGIYQLLGRFPALLIPGKRLALAWVSLKLGRLWLPFILLTLLVSSFGLPDPWRAAALAAQAAFYAAAALDRIVPEGTLLKRLSSPVRTFVVLVLAALSAVAVFFVSPASLWKETKVGKAKGEAGATK